MDVEPTYLRATVNGKILQLAFLEEVRSELARAERSRAPDGGVTIAVTAPRATVDISEEKSQSDFSQRQEQKNAFLEVTGSRQSVMRELAGIAAASINGDEEEEGPPPLEEITEG